MGENYDTIHKKLQNFDLLRKKNYGNMEKNDTIVN